MAEKKLEVKNLIISFKTVDGKVQAVRDISFNLHKGETLAIVGESGSGKSVTSKAILGISSGNAIVEGGEILYDGQDLLRISEDDFHKIRGDKIAMIFQDPLSSLDPIVRIGTQLTEAMILKNRQSRKNSRNDFNNKLSILYDNLCEYEFNNTNKSIEEIKEKNKVLVKDFDDLNLGFIAKENEYEAALTAGEEVLPDIDTIILLYNKEQDSDYKLLLNKIITKLESSIHPFYLKENEIKDIISALKECNPKLTYYSKANHTDKAIADQERNKIISLVKEAKAIVEKANQKEKANYFLIAFYEKMNPGVDIYSMDVKELNQIARDFTDNTFMLDFIEKTEMALKKAEAKCIEGKKVLRERFIKELEYFSQEEIDKKESYLRANELNPLIKDSINYLRVSKDSLAETFKYTFKVSLDKYFNSFSYNVKEQARFDRETKKYEKMKAKKGDVHYKVTPLALMNQKLLKEHICLVLTHIIESCDKYLNKAELDYHKEAITIIDFFKDKAKASLHKVTKESARAKAIKLMEEVGIPEPALRFKQYPFEFSGGMRQRIVIAIALAADPDILICDEPTTALDVTIQAQILELINKIKKERQLSIIFITHDLGVVANMADKIAVMYAGKIVEFGTDRDVFYDPKHPYTWALLASMPDLETKERLEAIPGTPPNMIYPPKGDAFALRNKYALKIDFEKQPPMFKVSETHSAATWLLHEDAPKVEMPKIVQSRIERIKKKQEEVNE